MQQVKVPFMRSNYYSNRKWLGGSEDLTDSMDGGGIFFTTNKDVDYLSEHTKTKMTSGRVVNRIKKHVQKTWKVLHIRVLCMNKMLDVYVRLWTTKNDVL